MDTFSKVPESSLQIDQSLQASAEEPSEKAIKKIKKVFSRGSWVFLFTFLPLTVLILISQNAVPGDLFYPVKRGLENAVLAGASFHPATRVAFRTDLTERRFEEAEKLLLARQDVTGLDTFIEEVIQAEQEIAALENEEAKKEVTEKLIKKIDEYQKKLVVIQVKTKEETSLIALPLPTSTPTQVLESTPSFAQPTPTPTSTPTPTPAPVVTEENKAVRAIDDTQKKLEEIKEQLEEENKGKGKSSDVRQDKDRGRDEDKNDKDDRDIEKEKKDDEKDDDEKDKDKGKKIKNV